MDKIDSGHDRSIRGPLPLPHEQLPALNGGIGVMGDKFIEPVWPAPANVAAFSTTRLGGVSHAPFDSLNLGDHVGDDPAAVHQNRQKLSDCLVLPSQPVWLEQQHGRGVVCLDGATGQTARAAPADAAWTMTPGQVCVVLTADCLPVLICDAAGTRVSAVHAGWRGLAAGVIEAAIGRLMPASGPLYAWLGPAIGPAVYEVDATVRDGLLAGDRGASGAFEPTRPGHWNADLYGLARRRLVVAGITGIFGGEYCTFQDSGQFFSYRRDGRCGRMASLIWLRD